MKTIIRIAKLELSILFYSPIAWFLLIVFLFQCGFLYTGQLGNFITLQATSSNKEFHVGLTNKVFSMPFGQPFGLLSEIMSKLYLYLPLLTMGLISRELSSGTIKLLYSSPMDISEIILGKFLSMMIYNFILILVLGIFVVIGSFNIPFIDYGLILSGLLGVYLLLCAYAAVGLFMSCLTAYQVVAGLSTFVLLALLAYIGSLWQDIDIVRDFTYALSISGRAIHMISGLISTKDVIYFLVIIYIFLGLSILKLKAGRETVPKTVGYGRYVLLVISALLISYVSSRPGLVRYFDATANKNQTLSLNARKIMEEIGDAPLEVVSYINILDQRYWRGQPAQRNADKDRWEPYLRFKPDIIFSYVYYYDSVPDPELYKRNAGKSLRQIAGDYAKAYKVDFRVFKSPEEMKKIVDLEPEQNRYVMQLKFKGKTTFLRLYDDNEAFPSEAETSAALERLTVKLPKIIFLQGQSERDPGGYDARSLRTLTSNITFRYSLVNQGFDVGTISLKNQEIPEDISALIIADPQTDFEPDVLEKIRKYIAGGGNLMITGEPGGSAILQPLIQPMGVGILDGRLIQPAKNHSPDLVLTYMTPAASALSKLVKKAYEDSLTIAMPGVMGLSYSQDGRYRIEPLLMTDAARSWLRTGGSGSDSANLMYNPESGDKKGAVPTALRLVRNINGHEQRIVITGDVDFLKVLDLRSQHIDIANYIFDTSLFGWLSNGKFPIDTTIPDSKDDHFNIGDSGVLVLKYVVLGILPASLLLFSVLLLKRRKKK